MKKYPLLLSLLITILSLAQNVFAQGWKPVGPNELNKITCTNAQGPMAVNKRNGHVFVCYPDARDSGKITVRMFNGSTWTSLGHMDVYGVFSGYKMAVDNYDDVYIMYDDPDNHHKATVQVYNGTKWSVVGYPGFSNGPIGANPYIYGYNLTLDTNGYPYVVYADSNLAGKATVKRYYGGAWLTVGSRGFSNGYIGHPTIKINKKTNQPFIAYEDQSLSLKIAVMQYNGTSWASPGPPAASDTLAVYPSLVIDSNSIPYVAYDDADAGDSTTVKTIDHSSWHTVGNRGLPTTKITTSDITMNKNSTLYVIASHNLLSYNGSYWDIVKGQVPDLDFFSTIKFTNNNDLYLNTKDKVYKLIDTTWHRLDTAGISDDNFVRNVSSATDTNSNLYVSYLTLQFRVHVKKHTSIGWQELDSGLYYIGYSYGTHTCIAIDKTTNQPYLSFIDTNYHIVVMKYNGISWQYMSTIGTSTNKFFLQQLKISNDGTKYIVSQNFSSYSVQVYKYTGSVWTRVGLNVADSIYYSTASLSLGNDNTPYIAYQNNIGTAIVKQYNSGSWNVFGDSIVPSPHYSYYDVKLAIDKNNTPYLAYTSHLSGAVNSDTIEVLRWEKAHWRHLHTPLRAAYGAWLNDLIIDNTNHPIISSTKNNGYYTPANILRYNGEEWKSIGDTNATPGNAYMPTLALTKNNTLYNTYINTTPNYWGDVFVRQYINIPTDTVLDTGDVVRNVRLYKKDLIIYPTPCHNSFTIKNWDKERNGTHMYVYDICGRLFRSLLMTKNKANTTDWPAGLYLLETDKGYSAKLIKE